MSPAVGKVWGVITLGCVHSSEHTAFSTLNFWTIKCILSNLGILKLHLNGIFQLQIGFLESDPWSNGCYNPSIHKTNFIYKNWHSAFPILATVPTLFTNQILIAYYLNLIHWMNFTRKYFLFKIRSIHLWSSAALKKTWKSFTILFSSSWMCTYLWSFP